MNWSRTDLIDESEEIVLHQTREQKEKLEDTSGVKIDDSKYGRVHVTDVKVNEDGENRIGKKQGQYVTISVPTLTVDDKDGFSQLESVLLEQLEALHADLTWGEDDKVLVIGLGNRVITPDAIGPFAIEHLHNSEQIDERLIMYAPGVTGQTGYETGEFVAALAERIKPNLIIVIDALATRASTRLCKTVQLTNTGIHPGSGVGNQRQEISYEVLGVPVTAIGVPTVVDAPVLIADSIELMLRSIASRVGERGKPSSKLSVTSWHPDEKQEVDMSLVTPIFGEWATWPKEDRLQLFEEIFSTAQSQLMVTPKEMDLWVEHYAVLISSVITKWISNKN